MYYFADDQIEEYRNQRVISLRMGDIGLPLRFDSSVQVDLSLLDDSTSAWISSNKKGSRRLVIASNIAANVPDRAASIKDSAALEVSVVAYRPHLGAKRSLTYKIQPV
tara:strand:+ start:1061 stop:1384 length:324 start_codon:yes stop_codon:yes gene_type:complete